MSITYDPMNYVGNTGTAISNIGSQIAQTVASIPGLIRADKAYQRAEEVYKSEDDLKTSAYTGTNSLFQKMGLNKSIRAPMKGETKDDYLQYIATEMLPVIADDNGELDEGKFSSIKERLGQIGLGGNKEVSNAFATRSFLDNTNPAGNTSGNAFQGQQAPQQTSGVQTPAPASNQPENPFADWTDKDFFPSLNNDTPVQESSPGTPIDLPGSTSESTDSKPSIVDIYSQHMNESIANLNKGVKGGYVSVADAEKQRQGYVDRLADLTMADIKNRLEERKLMAKEAEKQSMEEAATRQKQDFEKEKIGMENENRLAVAGMRQKSEFQGAREQQNALKAAEFDSKTKERLIAVEEGKYLLTELVNTFKSSNFGGATDIVGQSAAKIPFAGKFVAGKNKEYQNQKKLAAETWLRAATGAAAPPAEVQTYSNFLPDESDPPEIADKKTANFFNKVSAKAAGNASVLRLEGKGLERNGMVDLANIKYEQASLIEGMIDSARLSIPAISESGSEQETGADASKPLGDPLGIR